MIILGVTGGIAAYKSAELVRQLTKKGAKVHVVMTRNAQEFIAPITFQTLSGNPVQTDLFSLIEGSKIGHVAFADMADLVAIAPATANIIGKVANGIADDFLSTMIMATKSPVLFAPSMNVNMWESPVVQRNVATLKKDGYHFVGPEEGDLACEVIGQGRLAAVEDILEGIEDLLMEKDLRGERILITAGPTHEPIDPVRFVTNRSSGRMGFALAKMARRRGADVILVSGPTQLPAPRGNIRLIPVKTASEMRDAVLEHYKECSAIVKAAAVSDYRPKFTSDQKMKKLNAQLSLEMERNSDIIGEIGSLKGNRVLVGFAAETEDIIANGRKKLKEKHLDLIVANDVGRSDSGFGTETNKVVIIDSGGKVDPLSLKSKDEVAHIILGRVVEILRKRGRRRGKP
ncbi:MAG: bifunctional phosphopantothenoylcysteine decarboxylase/phosphopantothenate--cysteine ligase CoaBC [Syntrophobacterales bacterium]|nr:MAG: bifunctional phosphopantothenoylcysteine decarboxylase/phosphopantothenate--cysteine ligase CoaBC [Syntrophobacterales bacterium]